MSIIDLRTALQKSAISEAEYVAGKYNGIGADCVYNVTTDMYTCRATKPTVPFPMAAHVPTFALAVRWFESQGISTHTGWLPK